MKKFILSFLLLLMSTSQCFAESTQWNFLSTGIAYTRLLQSPAFPFGSIYAFKIDLQHYQLDLAMTNNDDEHSMTDIKGLVLSHNAAIGINGGFFSPNLVPLGLRIKAGKQLSSIKPISWWGIFYIKNNKPYIVAPKNFHRSSNISFAIQSGPRLIINGKIPALKAGFANRSALCITKNNHVIIAITNGFPITTKTLAQALQKPESTGGLNCINALNLDGGSSSQLYAAIGSFFLLIPSFAPVSDVILVKPHS